MSLYEEISGYYDELFPLKKTRLSFITSFLEREGMSILDVGCASGELALVLTKKKYRVFGIDLDKEMVDAAREKAKNGGIFILQIVNFDRVLAEKIKELPGIESENFTFHREYLYDSVAHRIRFQAGVTEKKSGTTKKYSELLYPLIFTELRTALENAGFSQLQFFGNESKAPYGKQSPALIVVARINLDRNNCFPGH